MNHLLPRVLAGRLLRGILRRRRTSLALSAAAQSAILVFALVAPSGAMAADPVLTTGLADYSPGSVVDIHGSGFGAGASYALPVKRPDGSIVLVDPASHAATPGWDTVTAAGDGSLAYDYQLDGIQGTYEVRAYPAAWNGDWSQAPIATITFTDAAAASLNQCANGTQQDTTSCPKVVSGGDWQNGDLNKNNSAYKEGDSVPFQELFSGLTGTNSVTIEWQALNSPGEHAYDYLTSWNRTVTSANPCYGVAGCVLGSPSPTWPIPLDTDSLASGCGFAGSQVSGVFTMWGGTITAVSGYSQAGCFPNSSNGYNSITVTFTADTPTPVLAWGGHLASQIDWGVGHSASAVNGSPYHMSQASCSFNCGSEDRAVRAGPQGAILVTPTLTTAVDSSTVPPGTPVTDTATIAGVSSNGFPAGVVDFSVCGPSTPAAPDCSTGGTPVGGDVPVIAGANSYTGTATSSAFSPTDPGIYCFRALYTPSAAALYSSIDHTDITLECFTVAVAEATTGSLKITKTLDRGGSNFDTGTTFAIDYSCVPSGPSDTVHLAKDGSTTINDIPVDSVCTVSEPGPLPGVTGYSWSTVMTGSPTAAMAAGATRSVTVANSLTRDTGSLEIDKTLDDGGSGFSDSFTIHYDCGNGLSGDEPIAAGGSATVGSIPTGSSCTVTEPILPDAPAGYSWGTPVFTPSDTVSIDTKGATVTVTVANSLSRIVLEGFSPEVTKTAEGAYTTTWKWGIDKTAAASTIYTAGGATGNVGYTVSVTHDAGTNSGIGVTGTITVNNPLSENVTATVTDQLSSGTDCTVTDGSGATLAPKDNQFTYNCTLAALPVGSLTNTATVTWAEQSLSPSNDLLTGGFVDFTSDPIVFTQTKVDDQVSVSDSVQGALGTVSSTDSSPKTFTYSGSLNGATATCMDFPNSATFTTNTSGTTGSDGATVKDCQGADLTVTKTAGVAYTRTYNWSISKAVDKTLVEQLGGGTATFNYTVTATQTGLTNSAWTVSGQITVTNPNDWEDVYATITDAVDNGGSCTVTSGVNQKVPKGASITRNYTCTYASAPSPASGTNTATATWSASTAHTTHGSASGTATFAFGSPTTLVNKTITVTDTFNGGSPTTLGTLTATDTTPYTTHAYTYARTLAVPTSNCVRYTNTARIVETNQTASKTIELCGPAKTGGLTMGYWQNKNGQSIITSYCNVPSSGALRTWLRTFDPFSDLSSTATCAQAATYVYNVVKSATAGGATLNAMLKGQMLATALDVYFSDAALSGNKIGAPAAIGSVAIDLTKICKMIDNSGGTGTCSGSFESVSPAFGGATSLTVLAMLTYQNASDPAVDAGANWYGQVKATQGLAKDAFDAINNGVAFAP